MGSGSIKMSKAELSPSDFIREYCAELERLSQTVAVAGWETVPYRSEALDEIVNMTLAQQTSKIDELRKINELYLSSIEKGTDEYSDRQMAWWAIASLGMRPLSDAFSLITDQDAIEVYNADHNQVFRSLNIFKCLSYTLDEISRNAWFELFERDEAVTVRMMEVANEILLQKKPATILQPFGTHWVKERFSVRRNRALLESRLLTPLMSTSGSRQIVGYMNVFRIIKLESCADEPLDH